MDEEDPRTFAEDVTNLLNDAAKKFDDLCMKRHEAGQQEYGALTFLENDVVRMMLEELADTANYCRMQGVKLMILQQRLEESGEVLAIGDSGEDIQLGFESFRGTKGGWDR